MLHLIPMTKRRIIFFQPRTDAADNYRTAVGGEQRWPPWGCLFLAPIANDQNLDVALVDARIDPTGWQDKISQLGPADLLAVSVMTGHAIKDAVLASTVARGCESRVVWGGPHVSLFASQTLAQAPVDAVIPGFGYSGFADLARDFASGDWPNRSGRGIRIREETSGVLASSSRAPAQSVELGERLPPPMLDLVNDWEPYVNSDVAIADRTISFVTSEGCTRSCTYCSEPTTSRRTWLIRDADSVLATVRELCRRSGANGVKLHDPNFFQELTRAFEIADRFAKDLALPWAATMHPADLEATSDSALLELSQRGLARVLVGLESPDRTLVRLAGKQYDPETIPQLVRKLTAARIRGMFTFIVGWPDADDSHYDRTIECAMRIRAEWAEHQAKIHFLEPWPGTPVFELLRRRGFQAPVTLEEWSNIDYYQARHAGLHDPRRLDQVRQANQSLSPYVDA